MPAKIRKRKIQDLGDMEFNPGDLAEDPECQQCNLPESNQHRLEQENRFRK